MRAWLTCLAAAGCAGTDVPGGPDAEVAPDAAVALADGAVAAPRCAQEGIVLTCLHETARIGDRDVHWQVPTGAAPPGGWPAVVMFHGSFAPAVLSWTGYEGDVLGSHDQTSTIRRLLEDGFAVVTPQAGLTGFWNTNVPPFSIDWELAPDHDFMLALFAALDGGMLGPLDGARLYAAGISSGGYMTSRMAVSYPGRFRALAVCSGSYATCAGPLCNVPELPADHPPTLFVHGALDPIVPLFTMESYQAELAAQGTPTDVLIKPDSAHRFLPQAVEGIPAWFSEHP